MTTVTITIATATRQGTEINNADATAVFRSATGAVAAALVDISGHPDSAPTTALLLAETAARVAAQLGGRAGLLSAGLLIRDPGDGDEPEPSAVGVVATRADDDRAVIAWCGDAHAYGWNGQRLHRYTTPHTLGEQLRANGAPWPIAAQHDNWVNAALAGATPATVFTVETDDPLIILTSDGLDALSTDDLTDLIRQHETNPAALAAALVNAVPTGPDGYRDDTTVAILRHPH
jgi:protein phosphatase